MWFRPWQCKKCILVVAAVAYIWFVSSLSRCLSSVCLLCTHANSRAVTHTYIPHVFLAGALAVSARSRTTRNWWERKFHELVSSLSPSLLSAAPSTTTATTTAATQAAAAVTEAAAFAVSSSAAAVTFFFLFFYFVFHDFFLAASAFAPTHPPVSVAAFPITTKRFHVCLIHTHAHLFCFFSAISIDFFVWHRWQPLATPFPTKLLFNCNYRVCIIE